MLRAMPPDLARFDAAIIDLDGTLVHTLGDFAAALGEMLEELGLPPIAPQAIEPLVGKGSEHLVLSVLNHVLAPVEPAESAIKAIANEARAKALLERAYARYQHHYGAINGRFATVYPGVEQGLKALAAHGLLLACLTNKPAVHARPLLAAKGLEGYFAQVFGGDDFARKKPDPLPLIETCKALGSTPARTLMIGDSSNDARAARAAGCPVLLVRYGYNHGRPVEEVDCDGVLDSLAELGAAASAPGA